MNHEPSELVEQISLRLGCIEQGQQAVVKKLKELRVQLDSSSSSMASMTDADKGI